jgi:outer membrane protein assembly factor BamB
VVNDRVYVQYRADGRDVLMCLDANNGEVRWEAGSGADYSGTDATYATGPRATPAVEGDLVWAVDGGGHLRCFRTHEPARQGLDEIWDVNLRPYFDAPMPRWGVAGSPLVEGGLVVVQPGGKAGSVVALDKKTGDVRWAAGNNPPSYSSPVAATVGGRRVIFALTGDALLAIRAEDGRVTGSYPWKTVPEVNVATPLVIDDYVFISSAYQMGWALLRAEAAGDGVNLVKVRERRGARAFQNHHSTSVYADRHLFGFDGMQGARLKCLNVDTGVVKEDWDAAGVAKGTLILAGRHLIVQTETGDLHLIEATADEFRPVARVPRVLSGHNNWATPALVNGRLFLRDEEKVVCYDVR